MEHIPNAHNGLHLLECLAHGDEQCIIKETNNQE